MRHLSAHSFEMVEVVDTPTGISVIGQPEEAFITLHGSSIRYRYDGGKPTELFGHLLHDGGSLRLYGTSQMQNFKCVRVNDNKCFLSVTLEGV